MTLLFNYDRMFLSPKQTSYKKEVSIMIITLTDQKINKKIKNNEQVITFVEEKILMLLSAYGLFSHQYQEYKINFNYRDYIILSPILYINNKKTILFPAFKLPRKKYPCHVYLFAVIKYITSDLNMRQVARSTRKKFGLDSFSAATVCRSVNKFIEIKDEFESDLQVEKINLNSRISLCKKLTNEIALQLLSSLKSVLNTPLSFTTQLVYKYFCKTGKFLF